MKLISEIVEILCPHIKTAEITHGFCRSRTVLLWPVHIGRLQTAALRCLKIIFMRGDHHHFLRCQIK